MLEVEVKYQVDSFDSVLEQLRRWDAELVEERSDADTYFNAPHRDFAQTDEALRLRRIGTRNLVTYKGPRCDAATKTRTEIEVPLGEGNACAEDTQRLLQELGFRPVATVRKRRRVFATKRAGYNVEICCDEVEQLGPYVEIEIIAPDHQFAKARNVVLQTAAELGLTVPEHRSYLELLLQVLEKGNAEA